MRRRVGTLAWVTSLAAAAVLWAACASPPPPAPPGSFQRGFGDIVRRHWDQPCRERWDVSTFVTVDEIFDTVGLGVELTAPGRSFVTVDARPPTLDFVTRYRTDGSVSASGVWDSAFDSLSTAELTEVLRRRTRVLTRLLEPEGFHTELTLEPAVRVEVRPPIDCSPHLVHEEGQPPTGLPEGVRTWVGRLYGNAPESQVSVMVHLDAEGRVTDVVMEQGSDATFAAAVDIVRGLRFDPAARNGEAVDARLRLSFDFAR